VIAVLAAARVRMSGMLVLRALVMMAERHAGAGHDGGYPLRRQRERQQQDREYT